MKYVSREGGSIVQAFYFEKALPVIDHACVPKWSSSQNPLFVKGFFCFVLNFFLYRFLLSI